VAVTYGSMAGPAELALADFRSAPLARVVGFFHHVPEDTKGEDLAILAGLVGGGRLRPQLGVTRDWAQTHEVLALLRDGDVRGKAVLTL
jgi:NADPH:quinone reductase-like Zn-dependent oxidoreductase